MKRNIGAELAARMTHVNEMLANGESVEAINRADVDRPQAVAAAMAEPYGTQPVPLYRRPHPTLTAEEREAIESAIAWIESPSIEDCVMPEDYKPITDTLRGLLERLK